jgi:homoserine dehydrogenase
VTANKALIAARGPALARLAAVRRRDGAALDFEAAVGGGIPVVRTLRDGLGGVGVSRVSGILNGTSKYVLSRLTQGFRFADAVREAQALGFAEADPSRDLSGRDAADKVAVLAWIAFGADPSLLTVHTRGIAGGADRLMAAARELGGTLRLVGDVRRTRSGVSAGVLPTLVAPHSPFASVRGEENLLVIESATSGEVRLAGRGAGGNPTAAALFADLLRPASPLCPPLTLFADEVERQPDVSVDAATSTWVVAVDARDVEGVRIVLHARGLAANREVRSGRTAALVVRRTLEKLEAAMASSGLGRTEWALAVHAVAGE